MCIRDRKYHFIITNSVGNQKLETSFQGTKSSSKNIIQYLLKWPLNILNHSLFLLTTHVTNIKITLEAVVSVSPIAFHHFLRILTSFLIANEFSLQLPLSQIIMAKWTLNIDFGHFEQKSWFDAFTLLTMGSPFALGCQVFA